MSLFSIFESSEGLFSHEVRSIFEEMTAELEASLGPEELFTFQALESHLAENDKRRTLGQEFGRRTDYLQAGGIVQHEVEGDTQEIVQGMQEGDLLGGLRHNNTTTAHLDSMLSDEQAEVVALAERAAARAQPAAQVMQDFQSREVA